MALECCDKLMQRGYFRIPKHFRNAKLGESASVGNVQCISATPVAYPFSYYSPTGTKMCSAVAAPCLRLEFRHRDL